MKTSMVLITAAVSIVSACQTQRASVPAVMTSADADTMAVVTRVVADAMGRASVALGPENLAASSVISVLPPPLGPGEDRSPATPTYFDLILSGGECLLIRRDTGELFTLDGVDCVPA